MQTVTVVKGLYDGGDIPTAADRLKLEQREALLTRASEDFPAALLGDFTYCPRSRGALWMSRRGAPCTVVSFRCGGLASPIVVEFSSDGIRTLCEPEDLKEA
jgi:hypothetical protein